MKRSYFSRLSLATRWQLPPAEARDVLSDYQELLTQNPRSEEELRRDLGDPVQAVRLLAQPKQYRRWLTVFWVLTACLLLPALGLLPGMAWLWDLFTQYLRALPVDLIFLLAGTVVSLVWFRREGRRDRPFPKKVLLILVLQLAGMAYLWFLIWLVVGEHFDLMYEMFAVPGAVGRSVNRLTWSIFLLALAGVFGLLKARLDDRRWRAAYVLGLTAAVLCMSLLSMLKGVSLDSSSTDWYMDHLRQYLLLTAVGLIGTGASLC